MFASVKKRFAEVYRALVRPEASSLLDDVVGHLYTPRAMATLFMFMCL